MNRTRKRRLLGLLSILFAFALLAAACGSDDDDDSSSSDDAAEEEEAAEEEAPAEEEEAAEEEAPAEEEEAPAEEEEAAADEEMADAMRIGILSECEGAFARNYEDTTAGAVLAVINESGATAVDRNDVLQGWEGGEIAGVPIELAGIACGDASPDKIIEETRRLIEQEGANVIVGPLSGDEGVAVAQFAIDTPGVTFVNGVSGGQETTLHVQAPNFFRFNNDGAQWNAGLGDILYNDAGWETAAVIADDYSFGWTSAAGFVADFCAAGGTIDTQVFSPLDAPDYSQYVEQLPDPDEVDGYLWVVGGTGTDASLQAFLDAKGELSGDQHAGNLFFNPAVLSTLGSDIAGAYYGGFSSMASDVSTPEIEAYLASADAAFDNIPGELSGNEDAPASLSASHGFTYGFYINTLGVLRALAEVDGDLSNDHEALRAAMSAIEIDDAPYGAVSLDGNRQAVAATSINQIYLDEETDELAARTVQITPAVDQTFGGTWNEDSPLIERDNTPCEAKDLPWHGDGAIPVVDGVPQN